MGKRIYKKQRHIRWNWEQSPDTVDTVRYHFIVVDNKNREVILNKILEQLSEYGKPIVQIRSVEGKVTDSEHRYLFRSYDTNQKPPMINFSRLGKPVKRDSDLKERKIGDIEDYVVRLYELA